MIDQTPDYIYGSGTTYDWTNGTVTVGPAAGLPDAFGPGVNLISSNQDSLGNYLYFNAIQPIYYIFGGWGDKTQLNTIFKNGFTGEQYPNGTYDCARCHTTGYRFDDTGAEPKDYLGNHIPADFFSRVPTDDDPTTTLQPGSWQLNGVQCERCHNPIAGDHYTKPQNQNSTLVCLSCHRNETIDTAAHTIFPGNGDANALGPAYSYFAVSDGGSCSDSVSPDYPTCVAAGSGWNYAPFFDHESGPTFLNSPHARLNGTVVQNAQNSPDLSVSVTGTYNSRFTDPADPTKNAGCVGCHDPHQTTVAVATANPPKPFVNNCADCHRLADTILQAGTHPHGPGTPFPTGTQADIPGACIICHMQAASGTAGSHLFRISTDPNYSTYPTAAQLYDPNTPQDTPNVASDGHLANAVWNDIDLACGQCHVGSGIITATPQGGAHVLDKATLAAAAEGNYLDWNGSPIHPSDPSTPNPTFSVGSGTYNTPQSVSLSDTIGSSAIYYTTDGSTPTTGSTTYSGIPIAVSSNITIKAMAIAKGYLPSYVRSATYTLQAAAATFSPQPGLYTTPQTVTVYDVTPGVILYYTLDGTTPTTASAVYSGPVPLSTNSTLSVIAVAGGFVNSPVARATYYFNLPTVAAPNFSPGPIGTFTNVVTVTLSATTSGATIYYSTDGSTPSTASTQYTAPFTVSTTTTIKAIAVKYGYNQSSVHSGTYTLVAAYPSFIPGAVGTFRPPVSVSLRDNTPGVTIYYTTDGSPPTTASTPYTGPITLSTTTTIKAIAAGNGFGPGGVASATYTMQ